MLPWELKNINKINNNSISPVVKGTQLTIPLVTSLQVREASLICWEIRTTITDRKFRISNRISMVSKARILQPLTTDRLLELRCKLIRLKSFRITFSFSHHLQEIAQRIFNILMILMVLNNISNSNNRETSGQLLEDQDREAWPMSRLKTTLVSIKIYRFKHLVAQTWLFRQVDIPTTVFRITLKQLSTYLMQ